MISKSHQNSCDEPLAEGTFVRTACNSVTPFFLGMPCAVYRSEAIYFCLPECKRDFEIDPAASCLASRIVEFG